MHYSSSFFLIWGVYLLLSSFLGCIRTVQHRSECYAHLSSDLKCPFSLNQIMRDPDTGNSRGFGFISYDSFEASDAAIEVRHCFAYWQSLNPATIHTTGCFYILYMKFLMPGRFKIICPLANLHRLISCPNLYWDTTQKRMKKKEES